MNDQWKPTYPLLWIRGAVDVSFGSFTGDEKGRDAILALASGRMPLLPYSQESK